MFKLLLSTVTALVIATSVNAGVSQKFIETQFSDDSTEAQRDFAWKEIKDKTTTITGRVYDVKTPGWIIKTYKVILQIDNGIRVYCDIPENESHRVKDVRFGDTFVCTGELDYQGWSFGTASIHIDSAEDGEFTANADVDAAVDKAVSAINSFFK